MAALRVQGSSRSNHRALKADNPCPLSNVIPRMPTLAFDLTEQPVMVIVLTCGFILNKGLVFSILFVLLCKAGPKVSGTGQSEADQSGLKGASEPVP